MRVKNSLKNIYAALQGQIITMLFSFFNRTIFIYYLGKTLLGVNSVFSNILNIFSLIELGVGQAITLRLYKAVARDDKDEIRVLLKLYKRLYIIIAFFIVLISIIFIPFLKYFIKTNESINHLVIIYLLFVVNSIIPYIYCYKTAIIVASEKNYIVSKINYKVSICTNLAQILVLYLTKSYIVYLIIAIIFGIIKNIYISYKVKKIYPYLEKKEKLLISTETKKSIFSEIRILTIYKIGTISLNYTDNIIISAFVGISIVGVYSNYVLIVGSVAGILGTIFQSLLGSIGNLNATESKEKQLFIFNVLNLASFLAYGLCSVVFLVLLNPFMGFWLGTGYRLDSFTLVIIILSFYISGMLFAPCNYRQTLGLFKYGKYRPVISAVLNIVISLILVGKLGIAGVLLGTIITRVLTNLWYDPYLIYRKVFKKPLRDYFKKYFSYFFITIMASGATKVITDNFNSNSFVNMAFKVIVAVVIFLLLAILAFIRTEEMQYLIKVIKRRI
ncbi:MAG: lipopolysaccharide biosynthesis protein [Sarcina sp.]